MFYTPPPGPSTPDYGAVAESLLSHYTRLVEDIASAERELTLFMACRPDMSHSANKEFLKQLETKAAQARGALAGALASAAFDGIV